MAFHSWQMEKHREPRCPLDQRANRRAVQTNDEVTLPMAGNRPVIGFGRAFGDHHRWRDELLASLVGAGSWDTERSAGSQASDEFTLQSAAALDVEGLVDGLVRDSHGLVCGKVDAKPVRNLFGAPCLGPTPVRSTTMSPTNELDLRPGTTWSSGRSIMPDKRS